MFINLKVKTLDAQIHEFVVDDEVTIRELKDKITEKTNISAEQQRIIYCGQVLADGKQLKEYNVDGKVVHVAERPPPSQRAVDPNVSTGENAPQSGERHSRSRTSTVGMRNSPLFRALDSIVVGTMTFPMNNNNNSIRPIRQTPLNASSSFCMNRITVARHMLQCADNIAAFLEDPSRGLNNTSLDILTNGRWTVESTVVEVGISGELPQHQNIVEMVQGALNAAAVHRNGNPNVTLFQMPTNDAGESSPATARVYIENITEDEINTAANRPNVISSNENENTEDDGDLANDNREQELTNANNTDRRRTGTRTLAAVIDQMRNVQNRLNPFIRQFYDFLQNEPTFEENDSEGRQNAQRLFDHVSEALHYMSHAQHAISDLMLDFSQPSPRYLTCRPILIDQSGFVSSNNLFTPGFLPPSLRQRLANHQQQQQQQQQTAENAWNTSADDESNNTTTTTTTVTCTLTSTCNNNSTSAAEIVGDSTNAGNASDSSNTTSASASNPDVNQQPQIRRLLQAIANVSPPINAEGIFLPSGVVEGAGSNASEQQPISTTCTTAAAATASSNASNDSTTTDNRAHVTTATLPTFSTQIRSTSRPQIANSAFNLNMSRGRNDNRPPNNTNTLSFDRFLPCNSHHIRDAEVNSARNAADTSGGNAGNTTVRNVSNSTSSPDCVVPSHRGQWVQLLDRINAIPRSDVQSNSTTDTVSSSASRNRNQALRQQQRSNSATRFGVIPMHTLLANASASTPITTASGVNTSRPVGSGDLFGPIAAIFGPEPLYSMARDNDDTGTDSDTDNPTNEQINVDGDDTASANSESENTSAVSDMGGITNANTANQIPGRTVNEHTINKTAKSPAGGIDASSAAAAAADSFCITTATGDVMRQTTKQDEVENECFNMEQQGPQATVRNLYVQLSNFFNNQMFDGKPMNDDTIPPAINRAVQWFGSTLLFLPQFEKPEYDSRDSLFNILRSTLPTVIDLIQTNQDDMQAFEQELRRICETIRQRMYTVLYVCIGADNAQIYWRQLMRLLLVRLERHFADEAKRFLYIYLNPIIPANMDEADVQQFIVQRNSTDAADDVNQSYMTFISPRNFFGAAAAATAITDVEMSETAGTSQPDIINVGSEAWHQHLPNDWLPIITRDVQKQSQNTGSQPPFSDVYISGMSGKRRKIIQNSKIPWNISSLIADGINKSIQNAAFDAPTTTNDQLQTPEELAAAISIDTSIQSSYIESLRVNLRERLKFDADFKPENYPQTEKFLNK